MKLIAFYLPQFHPIPENDEFWGDGFTEWVNVKNAKPLYEGHEQPIEPLNGNYYNLLDRDTLQWQADIANEYGVYGFCFYHYWIQGRKLLEKPIELFLSEKSINIKFCISWANHSWTDSWTGSKKMLISQTYGGKEDWEAHFQYLLPYFQDQRYIKTANKPLLLIFNPEDIPNLNQMLDYWQQRAKESGFEGLSVAYQNYYYGINRRYDKSRFDYGVEHQPAYAFYDYRSKAVMAVRQYGYKFLSFLERRLKIKINMNVTKLEKMDYDRLWECVLKRKPAEPNRIPGAFTNWDSTPRKGAHGLVVEGGSPQKFEYYLKQQIERAKNVYHKDMIFIAAWNEWAEGSMLEPDQKNGYGYLQALKNALKASGEL
jgi:hypothetical protein